MTKERPDLEKTLGTITKLLAEYMQINNSNNINALLDIQDKLSVWGMRLAELTADYMTTYNYHYFIRKIHVAEIKMNLIKSGSKIGEADAQALIENQESLNSEQENESIAFKADLMLKQLNKTLSSIQQRISYLKQEFDKVKS